MDEQLEVLRSIWGETSTLNGNVTTTNARLDVLKCEMAELRGEIKTGMIGIRHELRSEVGELRGEINTGMSVLRGDMDLVHRRPVERDLRLGTSLAELSHNVHDLTLLLHDWREEHRLERDDLRARVERLERRAGLEPR
jgi:hypothetical protein